MLKRHRLMLVLGLLFLLGSPLLMPSVRWSVYGWLREEAFYQGMPTSWWASEIQESFHEETPRIGRTCGLSS